MIQLEVNGNARVIEADSPSSLRQAIDGAVPAGHVLCSLVVDGCELSQGELATLEVGTVRSVRIASGAPRDLARAAIGETRDYVERVCRALEQLAKRYRTGDGPRARAELLEVVDALSVLAPLLSGIWRNLEVEPAHQAALREPWSQAEAELTREAERLLEAFESDDVIGLADTAGFGLPEVLRAFGKLLETLG